jgi:hypothetical protein
MMTKPSLSRRSFSASTSDRLGMNLTAPSSGRRGLRYWIITRVIFRRETAAESTLLNVHAIIDRG